jgi:uncharacterized membrane protein HdeD (DUF308 family)
MSRAAKTTISSVVTLVSIGTICWIAAGVIALAIGAEAKVIWTCVVGAALGITGIRYSVRRNRKSAI